MFEAFGRNKYSSTGVIQRILNNAWPGLIWHLYDYFLRPGGGDFGTKKALEPVHLQFSYDDRSVVVVSDRAAPLMRLRVEAKLYDIEMRERIAREVGVDVPADSALRAFAIPEPAGISPPILSVCGCLRAAAISSAAISIGFPRRQMSSIG